jgi:hypothetical protein
VRLLSDHFKLSSKNLRSKTMRGDAAGYQLSATSYQLVNA